MSNNDELLTWAVENITTWNDDYTDDDDFCTSFSTKTPQVITKQEWETAKLRNAFNTVLEMRHSSSKVDSTAQDGSESQGEAQQGLNEVQVGHIHAKVMAEYAEVAKTNPEPWKEFEKGILDDNGELEWVSMTLLDAFESWHKYRRKPSPPKTMTIGGIVVEAWPLESLNGISGDYIYTIESGVEHQVIAIPTKEIYTGPRYLAGKYFSTKEQAQAVADALNKLYNDALVGWKQQ